MNQKIGNGNEDDDSEADDLFNILQALKIQSLKLERLDRKVEQIEKTPTNDLTEIRRRLDVIEKELDKF